MAAQLLSQIFALADKDIDDSSSSSSSSSSESTNESSEESSVTDLRRGRHYRPRQATPPTIEEEEDKANGAFHWNRSPRRRRRRERRRRADINPRSSSHGRGGRGGGGGGGTRFREEEGHHHRRPHDYEDDISALTDASAEVEIGVGTPPQDASPPPAEVEDDEFHRKTSDPGAPSSIIPQKFDSRETIQKNNSALYKHRLSRYRMFRATSPPGSRSSHERLPSDERLLDQLNEQPIDEQQSRPSNHHRHRPPSLPPSPPPPPKKDIQTKKGSKNAKHPPHPPPSPPELLIHTDDDPRGRMAVVADEDSEGMMEMSLLTVDTALHDSPMELATTNPPPNHTQMEVEVYNNNNNNQKKDNLFTDTPSNLYNTMDQTTPETAQMTPMTATTSSSNPFMDHLLLDSNEILEKGPLITPANQQLHHDAQLPLGPTLPHPSPPTTTMTTALFFTTTTTTTQPTPLHPSDNALLNTTNSPPLFNPTNTSYAPPVDDQQLFQHSDEKNVINYTTLGIATTYTDGDDKDLGKPNDAPNDTLNIQHGGSMIEQNHYDHKNHLLPSVIMDVEMGHNNKQQIEPQKQQQQQQQQQLEKEVETNDAAVVHWPSTEMVVANATTTEKYHSTIPTSKDTSVNKQNIVVMPWDADAIQTPSSSHSNLKNQMRQGTVENENDSPMAISARKKYVESKRKEMVMLAKEQGYYSDYQKQAEVNDAKSSNHPEDEEEKGHDDNDNDNDNNNNNNRLSISFRARSRKKEQEEPKRRVLSPKKVFSQSLLPSLRSMSPVPTSAQSTEVEAENEHKLDDNDDDDDGDRPKEDTSLPLKKKKSRWTTKSMKPISPKKKKNKQATKINENNNGSASEQQLSGALSPNEGAVLALTSRDPTAPPEAPLAETLTKENRPSSPHGVRSPVVGRPPHSGHQFDKAVTTTDAVKSSKSRPFLNDSGKNISCIDDELLLGSLSSPFQNVATLDYNIPAIARSESWPTGSTSSRMAQDPTEGDDDARSQPRRVLDDATLIRTTTTTRSSVFSAMEHEKLHNKLVLRPDPDEKDDHVIHPTTVMQSDDCKEQLPDPPEERPPSENDDIVPHDIAFDDDDNNHHRFQSRAADPGPPFKREWMRSLWSAGDEIGPLNDHEPHMLLPGAMNLPSSLFLNSDPSLLGYHTEDDDDDIHDLISIEGDINDEKEQGGNRKGGGPSTPSAISTDGSGSDDNRNGIDLAIGGRRMEREKGQSTDVSNILFDTFKFKSDLSGNLDRKPQLRQTIGTRTTATVQEEIPGPNISLDSPSDLEVDFLELEMEEELEKRRELSEGKGEAAAAPTHRIKLSDGVPELPPLVLSPATKLKKDLAASEEKSGDEHLDETATTSRPSPDLELTNTLELQQSPIADEESPCPSPVKARRMRRSRLSGSARNLMQQFSASEDENDEDDGDESFGKEDSKAGGSDFQDDGYFNHHSLLMVPDLPDYIEPADLTVVEEVDEEFPLDELSAVRESVMEEMRAEAELAATTLQRICRGRLTRQHLLMETGVAKRRKWEPRTKSQSVTRIHSDMRRMARAQIRQRIAEGRKNPGTMVLAIRRVCAIRIQCRWRYANFKRILATRNQSATSIQRWYLQVRWRFIQAKFERNAVVMQIWWRKMRFQIALKTRRNAAASIQRWWMCSQTHKFEKEREIAACSIQHIWRDAIDSKKRWYAAIVIQRSWMRSKWSAILEYCATIIQRWWLDIAAQRGNTLIDEKGRYKKREDKYFSLLVFQSHVRRKLVQKRFSEVMVSILIIQAFLRGRICRCRYLRSLSNLILLQSISRAFIYSKLYRRERRLRFSYSAAIWKTKKTEVAKKIRIIQEKESNDITDEKAIPPYEKTVEGPSLIFDCPISTENGHIVVPSPVGNNEGASGAEPNLHSAGPSLSSISTAVGDLQTNEHSVVDNERNVSAATVVDFETASPHKETKVDHTPDSPESLFDVDDNVEIGPPEKFFFSAKKTHRDTDSKWVDPENFPTSWKQLRFEKAQKNENRTRQPAPLVDRPDPEERTKTEAVLKTHWDELKPFSYPRHSDDDPEHENNDEENTMTTALLAKKNGRLSRLRKKLTNPSSAFLLRESSSTSVNKQKIAGEKSKHKVDAFNLSTEADAEDEDTNMMYMPITDEDNDSVFVINQNSEGRSPATVSSLASNDQSSSSGLGAYRGRMSPQTSPTKRTFKSIALDSKFRKNGNKAESYEVSPTKMRQQQQHDTSKSGETEKSRLSKSASFLIQQQADHVMEEFF